MKRILLRSVLFFLVPVWALAQPCIPNTNSLKFDGTSAYVSLATETNLNTPVMTVEAWVYPTTFAINSDNGSVVCNHGWSGTGQQGFVLRCGGSGQVAFNIAGGAPGATTGNWKEAKSAINMISLNQWSHLAGTFDGDSVRLFINGVQAAATAFSGIVVGSPNNYPLCIGRLADPSQSNRRYFTGNIDEVRIWNRALTATELQANMSSQINPASAQGLVGLWRMNDGNLSTTVADLTTSNNTGTMNGGTLWDTLVPFTVASAAKPVISKTGFLLTSSASYGNQWILNNVDIANAIFTTYTATQNGTYKVRFTDTLGCMATSDSVQVLNVSVVSPSNAVYKLYPNPALQSAVALDLPEHTRPVQLEIVSVNGQRVFEEIIPAGQTKALLNLPSISKGLYLIRIQSEELNWSSSLIIE